MFFIYKNFKLEASLFNTYLIEEDYADYDFPAYLADLSYIGNRISVFCNYKYFTGFAYTYDASIENHYAPGMTNRTYSITAQYQLDERFNMRQLYYNNEMQVKSEGSFVFGLKYIYGRLSGLENAVPSEVSEDFEKLSDLKTIKYHSIAPGIGYIHNFNIHKGFYIGGALNFYYGYSYSTAVAEKATSESTIFLEGDLIFSVGYISSRFFIVLDYNHQEYSTAFFSFVDYYEDTYEKFDFKFGVKF